MYPLKNTLDKSFGGVPQKNNEINLKLNTLAIAENYAKESDYASALRYTNLFLTVRPGSAVAHNLAGECYLQLGNMNKALDSFKHSLLIDNKQIDIAEKFNKLMDKDIAERGWKEQEKSSWSKNHSMHSLNDSNVMNTIHMQSFSNKTLSNNSDELSSLKRSIKPHLDNGEVKLAYEAVLKNAPKMLNDEDTREYFLQVCRAYQRQKKEVLDKTFHVFYVYIIERTIASVLQKPDKSKKSLLECLTYLLELDKALLEADAVALNDLKDFIYHMSLQLCNHIVSLMLLFCMGNKKNLEQYVDMVTPLIVLCADIRIINNDGEHGVIKCIFDSCNSVALYNSIQSRYTILALSKSSMEQFLKKVIAKRSDTWEESLMQKLLDEFSGTKFDLEESHFVKYVKCLGIRTDLNVNVTIDDVEKHLLVFEELFPGSLHHIVWLGLHVLFAFDSKFPNTFTSVGFESLPFERKDCRFNAENLCILDVDIFLYATVLSAKFRSDKERRGLCEVEKLYLMPVDVCLNLCTSDQETWWNYAYQIASNASLVNKFNRTSIFRKGIDMVRLSANRIFSPHFVMRIARMLMDWAKNRYILPDISKALVNKSILYWKKLIDYLENPNLTFDNDFFPDKFNKFTNLEKENILDEGKVNMALLALETDNCDGALKLLKQVHSPKSYYNQAAIYLRLANDAMNSNSNNESSPSVIFLLNNAKKYFNLCKDSVNWDGTNSAYSDVYLKLEETNSLLNCLVGQNPTAHEQSPCIVEDETISVVLQRLNEMLECLDSSTRKMDALERENRELKDLLVLIKQQVIYVEEIAIMMKPQMSTLQQYVNSLATMTDAVEFNTNLCLPSYSVPIDFMTSAPSQPPYSFAGYKATSPCTAAETQLIYSSNSSTISYHPQSSSPNLFISASIPTPYEQQRSLSLAPNANHKVESVVPANVVITSSDVLPTATSLPQPTLSVTIPPQFRATQGKTAPCADIGLGIGIGIGDGVPKTRIHASTFDEKIQNKSDYYSITERMPNVSSVTFEKVSTSTVGVTDFSSKTHSFSGNNGFSTLKSLLTTTATTTAGISSCSSSSDICQSSSSVTATLYDVISTAVIANPTMTVSAVGFSNNSNNDNNDVVDDFITYLNTNGATFNLFYKDSCKLLQFVDTEWNERGIGQIAIYYDPINIIATLIMRDERLLLRCDQLINPNTELNRMSDNDNVLYWNGEDYSDGIVQYQTFAAHFETTERALHFKKAFDSLRLLLSGEEPSTICSVCLTYVEDENTLCPVCGFLTDVEKNGWKEKVESDVLNDVSLTDTDTETASDSISNDNSGEYESDPAVDSSATNRQLLSITDFGDIFKPAVGSWICDECYVTNKSDLNSCICCSALRKIPCKETETTGFGDRFKPELGSWICDGCYVRNKSDLNSCSCCSTSRNIPSQETKICPATFVGVNEKPSTTITTGFTNTSATIVNTAIANNRPFFISTGQTEDSIAKSLSSFINCETTAFSSIANIGAFSSSSWSLTTLIATKDGTSVFSTFSQPQTTSLTFDLPRLETDNFSSKYLNLQPSNTATKETVEEITCNIVTERDDSSETDKSEEDDIYFEPIIELPDEVPLVTGEENELVLHKSRVKLFRFVDSEWKERGVGDIKILSDKDTQKIRFLMRREPIEKICLNHYIFPELKLKAKSKRSYMWSAPDFSEGVVVNETFAVMFKTEDLAEEFKCAVEKIVEDMKISKPTEPIAPGEELLEDASGNEQLVAKTEVPSEDKAESIDCGDRDESLILKDESSNNSKTVDSNASTTDDELVHSASLKVEFDKSDSVMSFDSSTIFAGKSIDSSQKSIFDIAPSSTQNIFGGKPVNLPPIADGGFFSKNSSVLPATTENIFSGKISSSNIFNVKKAPSLGDNFLNFKQTNFSTSNIFDAEKNTDLTAGGLSIGKMTDLSTDGMFNFKTAEPSFYSKQVDFSTDTIFSGKLSDSTITSAISSGIGDSAINIEKNKIDFSKSNIFGRPTTDNTTVVGSIVNTADSNDKTNDFFASQQTVSVEQVDSVNSGITTTGKMIDSATIDVWNKKSNTLSDVCTFNYDQCNSSNKKSDKTVARRKLSAYKTSTIFGGKPSSGKFSPSFKIPDSFNKSATSSATNTTSNMQKTVITPKIAQEFSFAHNSHFTIDEKYDKSSLLLPSLTTDTSSTGNVPADINIFSATKTPLSMFPTFASLKPASTGSLFGHREVSNVSSILNYECDVTTATTPTSSSSTIFSPSTIVGSSAASCVENESSKKVDYLDDVFKSDFVSFRKGSDKCSTGNYSCDSASDNEVIKTSSLASTVSSSVCLPSKTISNNGTSLLPVSEHFTTIAATPTKFGNINNVPKQNTTSDAMKMSSSSDIANTTEVIESESESAVFITVSNLSSILSTLNVAGKENVDTSDKLDAIPNNDRRNLSSASEQANTSPTVYCCSAKLLKLENNVFTERGSGNIQILRNPSNGTYSLSMRREQQLDDVMLDSPISDGCFTPDKLPSNDADCLCWTGINIADDYDKPVTETFVIQFANVDQADKFRDVLACCMEKQLTDKEARTPSSVADGK